MIDDTDWPCDPLADQLAALLLDEGRDRYSETELHDYLAGARQFCGRGASDKAILHAAMSTALSKRAKCGDAVAAGRHLTLCMSCLAAERYSSAIRWVAVPVFLAAVFFISACLQALGAFG